MAGEVIGQNGNLSQYLGREYMVTHGFFTHTPIGARDVYLGVDATFSVIGESHIRSSMLIITTEQGYNTYIDPQNLDNTVDMTME